jgi:putative peptidoglycan lipid II flippase
MSNKTGKTFIGVSITIFFSKLLGFVREIVFASVFGTTVLTDMFQVVFSYPSLFFSSIGTALSAVNIPDLTFFITQRSKEERNQYLANLFAQVTLIATIITILGIIFAPALTRIIAPGFSAEVTHLAVLLTRIMMPTLLFVSLTFLTAGVLQVHQYFLISASISIPFNMLIIGSLLWKGSDLVFLGYVTTLGWLLQFLIQLPVLIREKYHWRFNLQWSDPYIRNTFKSILPILLGNSLLQLCLIIDRSFATHLSPGTASSLAFGSNLFVTITSVFIVAMATVVFPRLSQYCLDLDFGHIRLLLGQVFKMLLFILLPYLLLVVCYHQQIIALVYQRGAFGADSTAMTSLAFFFYSFAVLGYLCQEVYNRVFYALKRYKIPMLASGGCIMLNLALDYILFRSGGIIGLSLSTAATMLLYAIIMSVMLTREIGAFINRDLIVYLIKLLFPSLAMLGVVWGFRLSGIGTGPGLGFLLPLLGSMVIYLGVAFVLGLFKVFFLKEV